MPNFEEHLLYSSVVLNGILIIGILLLLWDNQELNKYAIILATVIPILYYIGDVSHDVDEPSVKKQKEFLM